MAAGQHALAVTQRSGTTATLFLGLDRTTPTPATGAGVLPSWAQPHIGTDANRRRVVLYPWCAGSDVRTCDLYQYDIDARTERPVPGVNRSEVGEVEGAMERGAVAFTRWTLPRAPLDDEVGATTTLLYRPATGKTRQVTRNGGEQIALHGRTVALVRDVDPAYGVCGRPSVQLLGVTGGRRRILRTYRCGMDAHRPRSPSFLGDRVLWAMLSVDAVTFSRWDASRRVVVSDRLAGAGVVAYAPMTWTSAGLLGTGFSGSKPVWRLTSVRDISLFPVLTSVRSRCGAPR